MANTTFDTESGPQNEASSAWYEGISRYQWIVLLMGSLGWIFDAFEGQLFVACMKQAIPDLIPDLGEADAAYYERLGLAAFLVGGAVGGFAFGALSDRIGRSTALMLTILTYSAFTGLTYFVTEWWQMLLLRFLAALGTGGEWAVASAMVSEAFPAKARARAASIFHGSSVLGTMLAAAIGAFVVGNESLGWRPAFIIGALPALVCVVIRFKMHSHPQRVQAEKDQLSNLVSGETSPWRKPDVIRNLIIGVSLATIGLATFWGVHVYGREAYLRSVQRAAEAELDTTIVLSAVQLKNQEMLGMWLATLGGGIGLFAFGPICERIGRRRAFQAFHVAAAITAVTLFYGMRDSSPWPIALWLPVFGFCTLGMHAGYAVYFPELFPTRIRGAAGGFCFNFARITAAPALFLSGWLQTPEQGYSFYEVSTAFSLLFLLGVPLIQFGPETRGRELPE